MVFVFTLSTVSAAILYRDIPLEQEEHYQTGKGSLTIRYSESISGKDKTSLVLSLKELPYDSNMEYYVWLVDEDSNYYNSLGAIKVSKTGRANFRFSDDSFPLFQYDRLLVTQEPSSDIDLQPSNHIFSAELPFASGKIAMKTKLNGRNEVPTVRTAANGEGAFTIDTQNNTLFFDITYKRLAGETAAHIHGFASPGQNGDVLFELPLGTQKTGSWNYPEEYEQKILEGKTYVNVHSSKFPSGEIRGQIVLK